MRLLAHVLVATTPQRWNDAQLQQCLTASGCPSAGGPHAGTVAGSALSVAGKADGGTYTPGEQITLTSPFVQYALYAWAADDGALGRQNNAALTITAPQTGALALLGVGANSASAAVVYETMTLSPQSANTACPCLASTPANTRRTFTLPGSSTETTYASSYGVGCSAHDSGLAPFCDRANPPAWCADAWCYVDPSNCAGMLYVDSALFPGLHYSHFTCNANANTFHSWFQNGAGESASGEAHTLDDLVGLVHTYLKAMAHHLETQHAALQAVTGFLPTCSGYTIACPIGSSLLVPVAQHVPALGLEWALDTNTLPDLALRTTSHRRRDGTPNGDAKTIDCLLSNDVFRPLALKTASKEVDLNRVGYMSFATEATGALTSWPAQRDCDGSSDPRSTARYVAAATPPKDVVLVLDMSGSMTGARMDAMQAGAKAVLRTLASADRVAIVDVYSSVMASSTTLSPATTAVVEALEQWVDASAAGGTFDLAAGLTKAWELFDATATTGCQRVVLIVADGAPNDATWDAAAAQSAAATRNAVVLGYGLAAPARYALRGLACATGGVYYGVDDVATLSERMPRYYAALVPRTQPCQTRWVADEDNFTGSVRTTACLAAYHTTASGGTACDGGLNDGTERQRLMGVACADLDLVVATDVWQAQTDASDLAAAIAADASACAASTPSEAHLEALRAGEADAESCADPPPSPPPEAPPSPFIDDSAAASIVNTIFGIVGGAIALCLCCCCACAILLARRNPRAQAQPPPQVYYAPTPQAVPVYPPVA